MKVLTPPAALAGDCRFLAANLYARSRFGEDALLNLAVEEGADGRLAGAVRIRSKTQGMALSVGDVLILKQNGRRRRERSRERGAGSGRSQVIFFSSSSFSFFFFCGLFPYFQREGERKRKRGGFREMKRKQGEIERIESGGLEGA